MPFETPGGSSLAALFENYLFVLAPALCFLLAWPVRMWALAKRKVIIRYSCLQAAKTV